VNEQVETRCGKHSFRCAVCNKAFSYKSSLVTHQRICSGEQPYCCAVCNKAFSQKSHLFRHLAYTEESGHTAVLYVIGHSVSRVV
jgi:KRAB domain-containing zinc finger protein